MSEKTQFLLTKLLFKSGASVVVCLSELNIKNSFDSLMEVKRKTVGLKVFEDIYNADPTGLGRFNPDNVSGFEGYPLFIDWSDISGIITVAIHDLTDRQQEVYDNWKPENEE